ncbi:MAG TPA: cyanophycinase [Pseudoxanthomonas sp.]|nr:cyanophycinase [Pseudoxanthomonas sp.]
MSPSRTSARRGWPAHLAWLVFSAVAICFPIADALAKATPKNEQQAGYRYYEIGDVHAQRPSPVAPGLMMVGGGEWPYEAFRWMIGKAGHGRIVILRAAGSTEAQDEFFKDIGGITAAQTLVFHDRRAASDPRVLDIVRQADGLFIAGGDQSNYVRYWKGTLLNDAINQHVRDGKPLGGTSAGLAIMGAWSYGAMDGGSLTSEEALKDPFGPAVTLVGDFLQLPLLPAHRVITDSHFGARERLGRLLTFVARLSKEQATSEIKGLGVDENTALCIDGDGIGQVFTDTDGKVWLVVPQVLVDMKAKGTAQEFGEFMQGRVQAGQAIDLPGFTVTGIGFGSRLLLPAFTVEKPAFQSEADLVKGRLVVRPLD